MIYRHHHSKGGQGGKRAWTGASGWRICDPDALIDLIELELTDGIKSSRRTARWCAVCLDWLTRYRKADEAGDDDRLSATQMMALCKKHCGKRHTKLNARRCVKGAYSCKRKSPHGV